MVEFYSVDANMYLFNDTNTVTIAFQMETLDEAEEFALQVDKHRHGIERFENIISIEDDLNAYFVNEGKVTIKKHTSEVLSSYEGRVISKE